MLYTIGYMLKSMSGLIFQLSCSWCLSRNTSSLYVSSLGHTMARCQKVSFLSSQSPHREFIFGSALNWI